MGLRVGMYTRVGWIGRGLPDRCSVMRERGHGMGGIEPEVRHRGLDFEPEMRHERFAAEMMHKGSEMTDFGPERRFEAKDF